MRRLGCRQRRRMGDADKKPISACLTGQSAIERSRRTLGGD
jgi:hypothetical protein